MYPSCGLRLQIITAYSLGGVHSSESSHSRCFPYHIPSPPSRIKNCVTTNQKTDAGRTWFLGTKKCRGHMARRAVRTDSCIVSTPSGYTVSGLGTVGMTPFTLRPIDLTLQQQAISVSGDQAMLCNRAIALLQHLAFAIKGGPRSRALAGASTPWQSWIATWKNYPSILTRALDARGIQFQTATGVEVASPFFSRPALLSTTRTRHGQEPGPSHTPKSQT